MADPVRSLPFNEVRQGLDIIALKDLDVVAAGSTGKVRPDMGITYHAIFAHCTVAGANASEAQIKASLTSIVGKLNGDAKYDASSTEVVMMTDFWNKQMRQTNVVGGVLRIPLYATHNMEIVSQDGPAWGCEAGDAKDGKVSSHEWAFGLDAAASVDGIKLYAAVSRSTPLGLHYTVRRTSDSRASIGVHRFADFDREAARTLLALHINETGGDGNVLETIGLRGDRQDIIAPLTPYEILKSKFQAWGCTQQTGYTHIPFAERGRPIDALPMTAQSLELNLGFGTAPNAFDILQECYEDSRVLN